MEKNFQSQFSGIGALSRALQIPTATVETGRQKWISWEELMKLPPIKVVSELCKQFTEADGFRQVLDKVTDCVYGVSCQVFHSGQQVPLFTLEVWGGEAQTAFVRFLTPRSPEIGDGIEIQVDGNFPITDGEGMLAEIRKTIREIRIDQMVY